MRAANTGISSVVDPYGRVQVQSPLFETGTWTGEVRWLDGVTWYVRTGDAVAWACMLVVVALLALPWSVDQKGAGLSIASDAEALARLRRPAFRTPARSENEAYRCKESMTWRS